MLLYTVAITFCLQSTPDSQCTYQMAHTEWDRVYRPNIEACIAYADKLIATGRFNMTGKKARVYCIRTEAIQDAYSRMLGSPQSH